MAKKEGQKTDTVSYWLTHADSDEEESEEDGENHNTVSYQLFKAGKKARGGRNEILTFHPTEHSRVVLSKDLRTATAERTPNALSCAMTSRVLQSNERFSVILDDCTPTFPFLIGAANSPLSNPDGYLYWQMKVEKDSLSLVEEGIPERDYVSYPYPPQVGYRYSAIRKFNGDLHFEVNGRDLGVAFTNVPEEVYGYVDFQCGTKFTIY